MERDSFIFYRTFYESIKKLPEEYQLELYNTIMTYSLDGIVLDNLSPITEAMFTLMKINIDNAQKKYDANVENGKKGGRPKKETQTKPNENLNDNVNDNDNDNDNNIPASEDESSTASAKASKHKYGEYKRVMLKDEELQKLQKDYENWQELIKYLDEYIEMKGYKAKSHYLCIRKWVVNAVKEEKQRQNKQTNGNIVNKGKTAEEEFLNDN